MICDAELEDGLAIACMERLIAKGHNDEFIGYCRRRAPASQRYGDELRKEEGRLRTEPAIR